MVKWWNFSSGDMVKCQNVILLFSYLQVLFFLLFLAVLTGSEVDFPHQYMFRVCHYRPLHLNIPLTIPLYLNHLCAPISLFIPLPLLYHIFSPSETLYIYLSLPIQHHFCPTCEPFSLSVILFFPFPPSLYQHLPYFWSYPNMSQITPCIYLLLPLFYVSLLWNCGIGIKIITYGEIM